jgi:asparagine synthase (glutamine-hydrolysing)
VFMCDHGDCKVLATHVDDFETLGLRRPTVDMAYVAAHLQNTGFRYRRTALTGITELPPGERVAFGRKVGAFDTVWSPAPFARSNAQITDTSVAEAALKDAVDGCVTAWAHCYQQVLLGVSGGLDSSIVASVLKRCGIGLSLINFLAMEGTLGDERRFVDALAQGLGHHVETTQETIGLVDIFHSDGSHLPRPVARAFAQSGSHFITEVGGRAGIDAVFSGGGGDNVFCYLRSSAPLADRLLSGAGPLAMLTTLRDVATVSGAGVGQIIRTALRRMWRRQPRWLWKPNRQFLTQACEAMAFDIEAHPWLSSEMGLLPGKREHIGLIIAVFNFLEGFGYERRWPVVYPLLSQPIIEACLRIPSWLWCANGSNRAVARSAYRRELPALTIARQSKGSFDRFAIEIIERHRRAIEDFICDGAMAGAGIIDKDEVRVAIRAMTSYRDLAWSRVLTITDTEAWVRSRS